MTELKTPLFTSDKVSAITGCSQGLLRQWRNRYGLCKRTPDDMRVKRFSVIDLCVIRTVVLLVACGARHSSAVEMADNYRTRRLFDRLYEEGHPTINLANMAGVMVLVFVREIADHVNCEVARHVVR